MKGFAPLLIVFVIVGLLFLLGFIPMATIVGQPGGNLGDNIDNAQQFDFKQSINARISGRCQSFQAKTSGIFLKNLPSAYSDKDMLDYDASYIELSVDSVDAPANQVHVGIKETIRGVDNLNYALVECNWLSESGRVNFACSENNRNIPWSALFIGRNVFFSVDGSCSIHYRIEFLNEDGTSRFTQQKALELPSPPQVKICPNGDVVPANDACPLIIEEGILERFWNWLGSLPFVGFLFK